MSKGDLSGGGSQPVRRRCQRETVSHKGIPATPVGTTRSYAEGLRASVSNSRFRGNTERRETQSDVKHNARFFCETGNVFLVCISSSHWCIPCVDIVSAVGL